MTQHQGLTIGYLSQRTGLAISAIRFYEKKGLLKPDRNAGGQRRFARADIRRLSFIMISQQLGFSLVDIGLLLQSLPDNRTPTKADWTRIGTTFRRLIDDRIKRLALLRDNLDGCIGCGCLSLKNCALYNPRDRAFQNGSGPRFLFGDSPAIENETAAPNQSRAGDR